MQDVQITPTGRCADIGITSGCCIPHRDSEGEGAEHCRVPRLDYTYCYCDARCHEIGDCCSDIDQIQCYDRELYIFTVLQLGAITSCATGIAFIVTCTNCPLSKYVYTGQPTCQLRLSTVRSYMYTIFIKVIQNLTLLYPLQPP